MLRRRGRGDTLVAHPLGGVFMSHVVRRVVRLSLAISLLVAGVCRAAPRSIFDEDEWVPPKASETPRPAPARDPAPTPPAAQPPATPKDPAPNPATVVTPPAPPAPVALKAIPTKPEQAKVRKVLKEVFA